VTPKPKKGFPTGPSNKADVSCVDLQESPDSLEAAESDSQKTEPAFAKVQTPRLDTKIILWPLRMHGRQHCPGKKDATKEDKEKLPM